MAINIGKNSDGDVTYQNPPVNRTLFPNIKYGATPEEIQEAVDAWLDDHPEATTTVEDGSILPVKLDSTNSATDGYVLSYNATAEKFEWYDIGGELDEINSDISDLKQDLEGLDVYTLGLYPQMSVADTAVASFTDGADNIPVKSLTVDITPVQTGTGDPSPENVRPISGWTGANVSVNGVNQWDEEWELGAYNTSTGEKTQSGSTIRNKNIIPIVDTQDYYFKLTGASSVYVTSYDANGNYLGLARKRVGNSTNVANSVFYVPSGTTYIGFYSSDYGTTYNHDISINYPTTDTSYHAYKGNVYPITFPTEAGTVYGGTLDVTNGVLTVDMAIVDMGTLNWSKATNGVGRYQVELPTAKDTNQGDVANAVCSAFPIASQSYVYSNNGYLGIGGSTNKFVWVSATDIYSDADTFKQAMADLNVKLVYELATPVTYQLTPTEVATILGQNNIFCDTGNINELTYRADMKAYIDAHVGS